MKERKPNGYWTQDTIIEEIRKIMKQHNFDKLPTNQELTNIGCNNLLAAIDRQGGFRKFRVLLSQEQIKIENSSWQNLEFTIQQAQQLLKEHPEYQTLPNSHILVQLGYSSLNSAIYKYYGGFHKFRELLGEASTREKNGSWQNLEFTLEQARNFLKIHPEYQTLPSPNILAQLKYSSLGRAILRYHGGFHKFRQLLGETSVRIKRGTWQSLEFTLEQARNFLKIHPEYATLPNGSILVQLGYSSLNQAINKYHNGYPVFRETLRQRMTGKSSKQELEDLLETYAGDD